MKRSRRGLARALAALAVLGAAPGVAAAPPPVELRGLWVVRNALATPASVDAVVDQASRAGFNALFVQVRGRGDAFYQSRLVPRSPLLQGQPADFDPLARLIARARPLGLQVHAWINVLLTGDFEALPPGHVVLLRPDWLMVPRGASRAVATTPVDGLPALVRRWAGGDAEGFYLSPAAPGVGEYLEAVEREVLAAYRVDGLHLDFIRYPSPEYDHSPAALAGFSGRTGWTGDASAAAAADGARWSAHRRDVLTRLVERLVAAARAERPGVTVSAAVVADEALAVSHRYQDWPSWIRRGLLDALCPMAYTSDPRTFRRQVAQAVLRAGGRPVWAGVGAYLLSGPAIVESVRAARAAGARGVVLFSHESLRASNVERLREEAFGPQAGAAARPAGAGGGPR